MSKLINYRGVRNAVLVGVLEGSGTEEAPFKVVDYVIMKRNDGINVTYGKVAPLTQDELNSIGSQDGVVITS